jgi:hypothetical protein
MLAAAAPAAASSTAREDDKSSRFMIPAAVERADGWVVMGDVEERNGEAEYEEVSDDTSVCLKGLQETTATDMRMQISHDCLVPLWLLE